MKNLVENNQRGDSYFRPGLYCVKGDKPGRQYSSYMGCYQTMASTDSGLYPLTKQFNAALL
jgi:hypothetical protein